jgi:hypothetical protein
MSGTWEQSGQLPFGENVLGGILGRIHYEEHPFSRLILQQNQSDFTLVSTTSYTFSEVEIPLRRRRILPSVPFASNQLQLITNFVQTSFEANASHKTEYRNIKPLCGKAKTTKTMMALPDVDLPDRSVASHALLYFAGLFAAVRTRTSHTENPN